MKKSTVPMSKKAATDKNYGGGVSTKTKSGSGKMRPNLAPKPAGKKGSMGGMGC